MNFQVDPETLAEMDRLKKRFGVTKNTEVLRCVIAEAKRVRDKGYAALLKPSNDNGVTDAR